MLDRIRASGKTVIPICAFTAGYIGRHPDYVDLVDPSLRGRFTFGELTTTTPPEGFMRRQGRAHAPSGR